MTQLTHILAASDLSAPARHAAERAALISKDTAAMLEVLHVANLAPLERLRLLMGASQTEMEQRVLDVARTKLHDLATTLQQRFGVSASTHVVAGALLTELAQRTGHSGSDLLVCGAKGESVIRHFALGTTALRMLSKTTCPVLVVKQSPHEAYRRILVPVDFSAASLKAIGQARSVAPLAEIVLLHAFDVPFEGHLRYASVDEDTIHHYQTIARQEATQKLHALRNEAGLAPHQCSLLVLHGDPASRIAEQEQEQDCDLIVMGKHGEGMLEELLIGSVTKRVLGDSQCDVLISV
jgi:nucleotide-binding universal stress UspA family protein